MTYSLFLDDVRDPYKVFPALPRPENDEWIIARTYQEAVKIVETTGYPKFVAFDHDLGLFSEGDGIKFVDYLIGADLDNPWMEKNGFDFSCHSANPVGKEKILRTLDRYIKFCKENPR